jgi:ubiquinone/menaquinone biosynthesis C-methylase UbiE
MAVDYSRLSRRIGHQLQIVEKMGIRIQPGASILDLGCGEGNTVRALRELGFDAWGCDIELWDSPGSNELKEKGWIRKIPMDPYRLPFDDKQFDLILTSEVLEHVMNYDDFIAENHRVQKDNGLSMHIFPGRYTPIEMHVFVPLASVHRSYPWLYLWALLGVRNEFQKGKPAKEVAQINWRYLREHTNYPTTRKIRQLFESRFSKVEFREDLFLDSAVSGRARLIKRLTSLVPLLLPVYRNCWNRVLVARR